MTYRMTKKVGKGCYQFNGFLYATDEYPSCSIEVQYDHIGRGTYKPLSGAVNHCQWLAAKVSALVKVG